MAHCLPTKKHTIVRTKRNMTKNINCSLGKDSCYLIILIEKLNKVARENNRPEPYPYDKVVLVDTTLEFDELLKFKDKFENYIKNNYNSNFKIEVYKNTKKTFKEFFYGKFIKGKYKGETRGFPYFTEKNNCWIRRDFKTSILDNLNLSAEVVYIGIAKDEEHRQYRKQYQILRDAGVKVIFPLIEQNITENECKEELKKINMLNPLYELGFTRLGCWLCPYQSEQSLYVLWSNFPVKWKELEQLEQDSPQGFRLNPLSDYVYLFERGGFILWDKTFIKKFRMQLDNLRILKTGQKTLENVV